MSFFGFLDAYQDGISIAIAFSCPDDTSQTLGWFMLVFYLTGVVVLQWAIMAILCFFDPSSACFAKMMHMDTFAARVTLPTEHQFTWKLLHLSRTLGEDVPQAVLQTIYLLTVTENYFMIISVCTAVCGSLLALYDAYHRALKAAGFHSKTVRVVRAVIRGGVQGLAFEMADGHLVGRLLNQDGSMRELSDWPNVQQDEVSLSLKLQWDECIVAVRGYSSDEPFLLCSRCIIFTNRGTRKQFPPPRDLRALASGEHFDFDFSTSEEAAIWSCEFAGGTCVGIQTR